MAEEQPTGIDGMDDETTLTREPGTGVTTRRPDPLALLVGLLALGMAVAAFVGQVPDLSWLDARWLVAGGAAAVGALLLVSSLRNRRSAG